MVTMDAYEYHQGNNPGNNDQYISSSDNDELLDRKDDILLQAAAVASSSSTSSRYNTNDYNYTGYPGQHQLPTSLQQPSTSSYYGATPYMMPSNSDVKPLISDISPLVPPMYLQQSPNSFPFNSNNASEYQSFNNMMGPGSSSNPFHQNYPYYKPWYNQVKSEQMANILNSSGREARNRAEKNRRDKLNNSIAELSSMVDHVADSPRRVDKTAVLRFAAHSLRINYVFGKAEKPPISAVRAADTLLSEILEGFLLTVTCRGQITLISSSVEQYLGHCQTDLFGQNLLNITHIDDQALLKQKLVPSNLSTLFESRLDDDGHPAIRTQEEEEEIERKLSQDRRNFTIRLARAGPRSEPTIYEVVRIDGSFRRADIAPRGVKSNSLPSGLQLIRRSRGRDDSIPLHTLSANDIVLVAVARIVKSPTICARLIEGMKYEYKTRHLIDGRIVEVDQRISLVAGYMTDEVSGVSPFSFMHKDDMRWVMVALRQMYDFSRPQGESCYRLMNRSGEFIYLKTRGFLEIDEKTNRVHSFVCVNTLVTEEEGKRLIDEMKRHYAVIIDQNEISAVTDYSNDVPAIENPQQLESAIMTLITNLGSTSNLDYNIPSVESDSSAESNCSSRSKSNATPLSIIAPQFNTIKSTVYKSAGILGPQSSSKKVKTTKSVVNNKSESGSMTTERPSVLKMHGNLSQQNNPTPPQMTIAMYQETRIKYEPPSPVSSSGRSSTGYCSPQNFTPTECSGEMMYQNTPNNNYQQYEMAQQSTSTAGMPNRTSYKRTYTEEEANYLSKRRIMMGCEEVEPCIRVLEDPNADLVNVLPESFNALDQSLNQIEDATLLLRDQFDLPVETLDGILDEHSSQREALQLIQAEFAEEVNDEMLNSTFKRSHN